MTSGLGNLWYGINSFTALALVGLFFAVPYRRLSLSSVGQVFDLRFGSRRCQSLTSLCVQTEYLVVNIIEPFVIGSIITGVTGLPLIVPQFWGVIIKRTPLWSGWATAFIGFASAITIHFLTSGNEQAIADALGWGVLSAADAKDLYFIAMNGGIIVICSVFFLGTMAFYKRSSAEDKAGLDKLFVKMNTPVEYEEENGHAATLDGMQFKVLGILATVFAAFLFVLILIPNDIQGRIVFLCIGGAMLFVGLLLLNGYRVINKREKAASINERLMGDSGKSD
jgi:hypothetical protein